MAAGSAVFCQLAGLFIEISRSADYNQPGIFVFLPEKLKGLDQTVMLLFLGKSSDVNKFSGRCYLAPPEAS